MTDVDTKEARIAQLEEARGLAMEGDYDRAINVADEFLSKSPFDLEALRLKGNVLELKSLERNEYNSKKLTTSRDYMLARECYQEILRHDPTNSTALIDLGDHYQNLEAYDQALHYYERAASVLKLDESRLSWKEEVQDIADRINEFAKQERLATRVAQLRSTCEEMLGRCA